jgi:hypothetical protein
MKRRAVRHLRQIRWKKHILPEFHFLWAMLGGFLPLLRSLEIIDSASSGIRDLSPVSAEITHTIFLHVLDVPPVL